MRINNIYLENYRIHQEKFIEFHKGVNLLLGSNGKGKSSILEAIGITLFSSSFRDGNTKGQQQCIKYGEKEALIKIEFVGNDEETYIIENQIKKSGGYNKLYRKSDPEDKLIVKEEITEKLKVLVGISGELKDVYENIIVAKQNEFINSFKLKSTDRQKLFDKIFNSEIYREIFDGYSKKTLDRYNSFYEKEKNFLEGLKQNIEDVVLLKDEFEKNQLEFLNKNEVIKVKILEETDLLKEINHVNTLNNRYNIQKKELLGLENLLESKKIDYKKNTEDIKKAKEALNILDENKEFYLKYLELIGVENEQKNICSNLELKVAELNKNKINNKDLLNTEGTLKGKINELNTRIVNEKEKLNIGLEEEKKLLNEKEIKEKDYIELNKNIENITHILKEFNLLKNKKEITDKIFNDASIIFEKNQRDVEKKVIEINAINEVVLVEKIAELKINDKLKAEKIGAINALETRIKDNLEAKEQLESKICPFLQEDCKNLQGKSSGEFFLNKDEVLKKELAISMEQLKDLEDSIKSLKDLEFQLKNLIKEKESLKEANRNLEKELLQLELYKKETQLQNLSIENFIQKNGTQENLQETLTKDKTNLNLLKMNETINNLKLKSDQIKEFKNKILDFEGQTDLLIKKQEIIKKEISIIEEKINDLEPFVNQNSQEKDKLNKITKEKESLTDPYKLYISNEKIAESLKNLEVLGEELLKFLEKSNEEIKTKTLEMEKLFEELKTSNVLEVLKDKEVTLKEDLKRLNKELGALENNKNSLSNRIEKNKTAMTIIREKDEIIKKLSKKIELTEKFRKNIKDMGIKVSQGMLEEISFWATDNFRKITGRPERVLWSNLENPYEVSLVGDKKITFEQLSGGEQVAVAIAIRGAMSNIFTKTKFSIFDEPTNNLDGEKRKSLADNIGEILKDLHQSIIVTHDDSFREMAEKVIEL